MNSVIDERIRKKIEYINDMLSYIRNPLPKEDITDYLMNELVNIKYGWQKEVFLNRIVTSLEKVYFFYLNKVNVENNIRSWNEDEMAFSNR